MFLVNSRLGLISAAASLQRPFSRGYGAILPSSLTAVSPLASACSAGPPVSVCGTGARPLAGGRFSRAAVATGSPEGFPGWPRKGRHRTGASRTPPALSRPSRRPTGARCRNVDLPPIGCALGLRLRPRLTLGGRAFPRKPRAVGGRHSQPPLATRASILTPPRSTAPRRRRFSARGKLPYRWNNGSIPPLRRLA